MFRVSITPIIKSIQNCNYNRRYWTYCLCSYLPPTLPNPTWPSQLNHVGGRQLHKKYDQYRRLQLQFYVFQMMGVVDTRNMQNEFISVFNQLEVQNLFQNKFCFMPLHVSSTCAHHQEVKISLHSLWYHHTYRCDDTRGCVMKF